MRARTIGIAAGILGSAVAVVVARQLIKRRRLAAEEAGPKPFDEEPLDAILVVEDIVDLGELYEYNEMPGGIPAQALSAIEDRAQAHGESWIEALQEQSIEFGPDAESVLVFLDETDLEPAPTTEDQPIADRGSGGPRGA